ncbi:MAG: SpoIIE family protein phosphatase [Phycisphaerae bacterium]
MATLRYIDGESRLCTRTLDSEQFVIGRADTCQLTIQDDMISREHVRIDLEREGRYRIRDLGSRNKTYVNGELITETLLTSGDVIRIGDYVLEYLDDGGYPQKIDLEFLTPDSSEPPHCDWIKTKAPLSLTVDQVEKLSQLLGDQPLTARAEDIANAALSHVILEMGAERGFIAMKGDGKTDLILLAQRALKRPPGGSLTPVSQTFAVAPLLQQVAGRYPETNGKLDLKMGFAATAVVAPLTHNGDTIGVLYIDRPASKRAFPSNALPYCAAAAMQIGTHIASTTRKLIRSAVREGAAWMTAIRRIQGAMMDSPQSTESFECVGKLMPGRARCGDFGQVVHLDGQRCSGLLVDGGGHGIGGLAQANAICASVRAALSVSDEVLMDPGPLFNELNLMMAAKPTRQVIPCTYLGIDMNAGKLMYINAGGMPPLLMVAAGRLITLDQHSLVLGVDPDYTYEATRVDLPEQFKVLCHTDGLTEAVSSAGEPMGEQRLHELLLDKDAFMPSDELVEKISSAWTTHLAGTQSDDDAYVLVLGRS